MTRRTFEELRGEGAGWCASLAYWLGSYRGALDSQTIVEIAGVMRFQYDFEEQADAYGAALPEEQSWTAAFAPIAPVQLAAGWSPIPTAVEVLGEPVVEVAVADDATGIRLAAAAWDAVAVAAVTTTTRRSAHADDKRFLGLLTVGVTRAQEARAGALLVAKPGWSYTHARAISKRTARLMGKAGFVVTSRRP